MQLYAGVIPRGSGYYVGWCFWLTFVTTMLDFAVFFLLLSQKPTGVPSFQKEEEGRAAPAPAAQPAAPAPAAPAPAAHRVPQRKPPSAAPPTAARRPPPPPAPRRAPPQKTMMRALYDCAADEDGDLAFRAGDMLELVSEEPGNGWVTGRLGARVGILPSNYVERV